MNIPEDYCVHLHGGLDINLSRSNKNLVDITPCHYYPVVDTVTPDSNLFLNEKLVALRSDNMPDFCSDCTHLESTGQRCAIKTFIHQELITDTLYKDLTGPVYIKFNFDTTCNLACAICEPNFSSRWRSEENIRQVSSMSEDTLRSIIKNLDLSNIQKIQILGGEPFLSKLNRVILEELQPHAHKIVLLYSSNATTVVTDTIINLWRSFKEVRIKFSIDGVEDVFNYLRWPGNWNVTVSVLNFYKNLELNNLRLSISPSLGVLNVHTMNDLKTWWMRNYKKDINGNQIIFDPLPTEGLFSTQNMSQYMIDDVRKIYANQPNILFYIPTKETANSLSIVKSRLEELDKKRKLDYRISLPHLSKYLDVVN
jgi:hypothetical protein